MAISVTGLDVHTQVGTGTWTDYVSGPASSSTTATFLSSTSARGRKFTGFKGFAFEINASGESLENSIVLVRFLVNGGLGATLAADGARIRLEDTSANTSDWTVAGSDTYKGGWFEAVIDTANTETLNSGTAATLSTIRYVGIYLNAAASSGGDPNVYVDEVLTMPNTGLTLAGNTTQLFNELATWDDASLYGVITKKSGAIFSKCPLILSPDASDHVSSDEILVFEEPIYEDNTNIDSALTLQGMSSADSDTITLTRLTAVCAKNTSINGTNANKKLDFASATDIVATNSVFNGFNGTVAALGGSGNDYTGCTFQNCAKITDTGAVLRSCTFRNTITTAGSYLWVNAQSDIQSSAFDVASGTHGIQHDTIESVYAGSSTNTGSETTTLESSTSDFVTGTPVAVGEYIYNETDNSYGKITVITDSDTLQHEALQGGTNNFWTNGDAFSISPVQTYTNLTFSGAGTHVNNTATGNDGLFVSKSGTSDPSTATGNVKFIGSVPITITVVDKDNQGIGTAQTAVYLSSDNSELLNTDTNGSGVASGSFTGSTPATVYIRVRKNSPGDTRYRTFSTSGTIESSTGLSATIVLRQDDIVT